MKAKATCLTISHRQTLRVACSCALIAALASGFAKANDQNDYDQFKSRYRKDIYGLANPISVFQGYQYLNALMNVEQFRKTLEITPAQHKALELAANAILKIRDRESWNPPEGSYFHEILDLSQQAKLAAIINSEEGLLIIRYAFVRDILDISDDQANKFKNLLQKHELDDSMKGLEMFMSPPRKELNSAVAKKNLIKNAETFDRAIWETVLTEKQKRKLKRLPTVSPDSFPYSKAVWQ